MEPTDPVQSWLADFVAGRQGSERSFVLALREEVWKAIHSRFQDLARDAREIEGRVFALLVDWREPPTKLRPNEPLWKLARRLVDQVGQLERARAKRGRAAAQAAHALEMLGEEPADPSSHCIAKDLAGKLSLLLDRLPPEHWQTMRAVVLEATGQGPPVAELLGISRDAARMRIVRARTRLLAMALREKVLAPNEIPGLTQLKEVTHV